MNDSQQKISQERGQAESPATARGATVDFRPGRKAMLLAFLCSSLTASSAEHKPGPIAPSSTSVTNSFPDVSEVLQGRAFDSKSERDIFFIRKIRERYANHWPALLAANIAVKDYVESPDKLLRFVEELGIAIEDTDDLIATTNLAVIASDPAFYANTNAYRPNILRETARTLIKIGPRGHQALADSFTEAHYRTDTPSLEVLAETIGKSGLADAKLTAALAATTFTFSATNGGCYPRCTRVSTANLLRLPDGPSTVKEHLNKEALGDPGRFQSVVDGIADARAAQLAPDLAELSHKTIAKLATLAPPPDPFRAEMQELLNRIQQTISLLQKPADASAR